MMDEDKVCALCGKKDEMYTRCGGNYLLCGWLSRYDNMLWYWTIYGLKERDKCLESSQTSVCDDCIDRMKNSYPPKLELVSVSEDDIDFRSRTSDIDYVAHESGKARLVRYPRTRS